ncbi:hypothetical protein EZV62_010890 [Acer yangbiense]|uniref:Uncharacterized protein n=1 Tax=Acer yangbiense TaxID=1000413 RepID=A0A5C7I5R8_9ROSI|nr:hypothetical protein EZV62_010890 [Acer yangbiense]
MVCLGLQAGLTRLSPRPAMAVLPSQAGPVLSPGIIRPGLLRARHNLLGHSTIHSLQNPSPLLSRRLFLPSVSSIWDALTGSNNNAREAVVATRRGMSLFRQVQNSDFASFEEGAEQFRFDVAQNPNDTEESIWCFLCEAQLYGVDGARERFLEAIIDATALVTERLGSYIRLLRDKSVGRDPRPVMRGAYNMFKDGGDPEKLAAEFSSGPVNEYFYSSLYAGLYYESQKKAEEAKLHILAASKSPYGQGSDDYMASLAKVHCHCRGWNSS